MGAAQLRLIAQTGVAGIQRTIPRTANQTRRDALDYLADTGLVAPTQAAAVRALARRSGATEHHILIHRYIVSEQELAGAEAQVENLTLADLGA